MALDTHSSLPRVWDSEIHKSGAMAIVVFIDRASMDLTLKAARRAAKRGNAIPWKDNGDDSTTSSTTTTLGLARYKQHKLLQYPPRQDLLRAVNAYMTIYSSLESARALSSAKKRAEPDDDGFITVTRGSKGVARMDEAKALAEKQRLAAQAKKEGTADFYRFQNRERRKDAQEGMRRRFEEDKRVVEEMRKRRKGVGS